MKADKICTGTQAVLDLFPSTQKYFKPSAVIIAIFNNNRCSFCVTTASDFEKQRADFVARFKRYGISTLNSAVLAQAEPHIGSHPGVGISTQLKYRHLVWYHMLKSRGLQIIGLDGLAEKDVIVTQENIKHKEFSLIKERDQKILDGFLSASMAAPKTNNLAARLKAVLDRNNLGRADASEPVKQNSVVAIEYETPKTKKEEYLGRLVLHQDREAIIIERVRAKSKPSFKVSNSQRRCFSEASLVIRYPGGKSMLWVSFNEIAFITEAMRAPGNNRITTSGVEKNTKPLNQKESEMRKETVEIIEVTPELATKWLNEHNKGNRHLRKTHVEYLVKNINNDCFFITTGGIGFDTNGVLVDGQHRLQAIAEAGKAVHIAVFRNINPAAYPHIDTGIRKNSADRLRLDKKLGEVINFTYTLCSTCSKSGRVTATPEEMQRFAEIVEPYYSLLTTTSSKYFSKAPIMVGAIMQMILNPGCIDEITLAYNGVASGRATNNMTESWIALFINGSTQIEKENPDITFCRAMMAFNPANKDKLRMLMTEQKRETIMTKGRAAIRELVDSVL